MLIDGPTEAEASAVTEHVQYLERAVSERVVLLAGRTQTTNEKSFGIVIFRAANDEAAFRFMLGDPGVKHGVMQAELFPYRVALLAETWDDD